MYLYVGNWKFKVMERKEVERQAVALRMTALDGHGPHSHLSSPQNGASQHDASTRHELENGAPEPICGDIHTFLAASVPKALLLLACMSRCACHAQILTEADVCIHAA